MGIPHRGWKSIEMIDLGEGLEGLDADERKDYYETCQMCSQEGIRFVHVMEHPNFSDQLRVGYKCAERMEEDYINPKKRESELRNKYNRRHNFLKKEWSRNSKGNYCLKYRGYYITIMPSKYKTDEYGVIFQKKAIWDYKGRKTKSLFDAQLVAFNLIYECIMECRNDIIKY
ncbi:hypothetical protein [Paenibacillus sp. IHBB 10380]|uniref:hypothetical protein n=1 Tax=Paenibacillus sp. IHBB 10380 TaxID=1566358 RepID=UPI0005CFB3D1|nr:hypothetical protein [Paenibacillus sp. IHBB 10380]